MLICGGYPPALYVSGNRREYLDALAAADAGDFEPFIGVTARALIRRTAICIYFTRRERRQWRGGTRTDQELRNCPRESQKGVTNMAGAPDGLDITVLTPVKFKILEQYEGKELTLEDLKTAISLKYLWLELILNEALVQHLKDTGEYADQIEKAAAWYHAFKGELAVNGVINRELEQVAPYDIGNEEFRTDLRSFRKVVYYEGFIRKPCE